MSFGYELKRPINFFPEETLERIHEATLVVLRDIGIKIMDRSALQIMSDGGCNVDFDKMIVYYPPELVENCIKKCPSTYTMHARNPSYDLHFDLNRVYFGGCGGMDILDTSTTSRKKGTKKDAIDAVILCDALENIARSTPGVAWLTDVPKEIVMEMLVAISLRYSEKITTVYSMGRCAEWGVKMAEVCGVDILVGASSASPLGWDKSQIDVVKLALDHNLPVNLQSQASPGSVAPATLAGSAVVMNAEVLGLTVLIELMKPETPVMYSCFSMPTDMRTGSTAGGAIEFGMLTALSAQLARSYGMTSIIYQPQTDSKTHDEQAGYEKALQWGLAGQAGINLICGAGILGGQELWSKEQLVIDSEIIGMVGRLIDGIEITDETLAVDVIREVGHFPHHYLGTSHTRKWWKQEQYLPLLPSREFYESWVKQGKKDVLIRAGEKVNDLLKHHVPALPHKDVDKEIDVILKKAAEGYGIDL